jgi:hypothetical protein
MGIGRDHGVAAGRGRRVGASRGGFVSTIRFAFYRLELAVNREFHATAR